MASEESGSQTTTGIQANFQMTFLMGSELSSKLIRIKSRK
jgi:hypothetical protein